MCRDVFNPWLPLPFLPFHLCRDVFNPWLPLPFLPFHLCRDVLNPWRPFPLSICVEMFLILDSPSPSPLFICVEMFLILDSPSHFSLSICVEIFVDLDTLPLCGFSPWSSNLYVEWCRSLFPSLLYFHANWPHKIPTVTVYIFLVHSDFEVSQLPKFALLPLPTIISLRPFAFHLQLSVRPYCGV